MEDTLFVTKLLMTTKRFSPERQRAAVHAVLMPFAAVADALGAVRFAFQTLLPPGYTDQQTNYARCCHQISMLGQIIPVRWVLRCINPNAFPLAVKTIEEYKATVHPILQWYEQGNAFLNTSIRELAASQNLLKRHVAARMVCLALAIYSVVARAFLLVVGSFALLIALAHKADNPRYNVLATACLETPGVIGDLLTCALLCINPSLSSEESLNPIFALSSVNMLNTQDLLFFLGTTSVGRFLNV